jgi:nicotinamide mononucleotide transporter
MNKLTYWLFGLLSIVLLVAAYFKWLPTDIIEVAGFITGVVCVWLVVKQNIWNWSIGIANSVFFLYTFWTANLFADSMLQIVYIVLGFLGWYWWLYGGEGRTKLVVGRIGPVEISLQIALSLVALYWLNDYLVSIQDAAPFLDALTTILSLNAQYMLSRKYLENWLVWIVADVIYIGLYIYKGLYLTSLTYVVFLTMCFVGLVAWRKAWTVQQKSDS